MPRRLPILAAVTLTLAAGPALAWGDLGHKAIALAAYRQLRPSVRARVDALLASDPDTLTAPDFVSRATWADRYRATHPETALWHFVDIEVDHLDLAKACYGFPKLAPGQLASAGPAKDCIVNKIDEFEKELRDPATPQRERVLALKFLIHFVGDLHQPLHAADHHDRGGNCVALDPSPDGQSTNLHAYWDTGAVEEIGSTPDAIAERINGRITQLEAQTWRQGDAASWAMETYNHALDSIYQKYPGLPACGEPGTVDLSPAGQTSAELTAVSQMRRAAVRLAAVLNRDLGG